MIFFADKANFLYALTTEITSISYTFGLVEMRLQCGSPSNGGDEKGKRIEAVEEEGAGIGGGQQYLKIIIILFDHFVFHNCKIQSHFYEEVTFNTLFDGINDLEC